MTMGTGLGGNFAPSVDAARKALGAATPIDTRVHPGGAKGSKMSLEEVSKRMWEGRNDPRIRAWAGKAIIAAGKPTSAKGRTQALLDALRKQTVYGPDPVNTELIAKAHVTLCLDPNGLCIPISDCDDLTVALGAATLSIGIPTKVVGQAFQGETSASHVLLAVEDEMSNWLRVDPSHKTYKVGESHPGAVKEWWLNPADTSHKSLAGQDSTGDFVGVGGVAEEGVQGIPWMGLRAFCLGRGLGQSGGLSQAQFNVLTGEIQSAVYRLEQARNNLGASLQKVQQTRIAARPDAPFDPEPATPITSVADFPTANLWTQSMDAVSVQVYDIADRLVQYGHEALNGVRKILVDPDSQNAFIESKPDDPWGVHAVVRTAETVILGFFDRAGQLLSGIDGKSGAALTAAQVQQVIQQNPGAPQGTGQAPIIIVGLVVGAVVSVAIVYAFVKYCESASSQAESVVKDDIVKCIAAGNCPPAMLDAHEKNVVAEKQADAANKEADPFSKGLANIGNIFMWAAIGGIAVTGIVLLAPIVQGALEAKRAVHPKTAENPMRRRRYRRIAR